MELWVLACGLSPGIGAKAAGMGVGTHSWIILSDLECSSLQSWLQWDGGAGKVGVGNIPPGSLDLRLLLVLLGKSPWFPGSDLIQQPGSFVAVGWRAVQSRDFLTPNTVTRSLHTLGGSLSLDPSPPLTSS